MFKIMPVLGALLLASTAVMGADPSVPELVNPVRRDVSEWIRLPGNTEADVEISLYARASGLLTDFALDVGDKVKPGQVIGKIDAPDMEQDIKLAESQVAYAKAELVAAQAQADRVYIRSNELDAKEAIVRGDVLKESAELELAQKQYNRVKKLFDTNAATDADRETHELTVHVHQLSLAAAESKLAAIRADRQIWDKDQHVAAAAIESARSKVAISEAMLQRTKVLYSFTEIKVPKLGLGRESSSAVVLKRFVSNGELIAGGIAVSKSGQQPLVTVVVNDPVRVVSDVPEGESANIQNGTVVQANFTALPSEKPVLGKIARISPSLMSNTRTLRIEMDVPNPDGKFRAGMMAYVELVSNVHKNVLAVPQTAVQNGKQTATVITYKAGKLQRTPVDVGYADHGWVEVRSEELTEASQVVKEYSKGVADAVAAEISKPPVLGVETAGK